MIQVTGGDVEDSGAVIGPRHGLLARLPRPRFEHTEEAAHEAEQVGVEREAEQLRNEGQQRVDQAIRKVERLRTDAERVAPEAERLRPEADEHVAQAEQQAEHLRAEAQQQLDESAGEAQLLSTEAKEQTEHAADKAQRILAEATEHVDQANRECQSLRTEAHERVRRAVQEAERAKADAGRLRAGATNERTRAQDEAESMRAEAAQEFERVAEQAKRLVENGEAERKRIVDEALSNAEGTRSDAQHVIDEFRSEAEAERILVVAKAEDEATSRGASDQAERVRSAAAEAAQCIRFEAAAILAEARSREASIAETVAEIDKRLDDLRRQHDAAVLARSVAEAEAERVLGSANEDASRVTTQSRQRADELIANGEVEAAHVREMTCRRVDEALDLLTDRLNTAGEVRERMIETAQAQINRLQDEANRKILVQKEEVLAQARSTGQQVVEDAIAAAVSLRSEAQTRLEQAEKQCALTLGKARSQADLLRSEAAGVFAQRIADADAYALRILRSGQEQAQAVRESVVSFRSDLSAMLETFAGLAPVLDRAIHVIDEVSSGAGHDLVRGKVDQERMPLTDAAGEHRAPRLARPSTQRRSGPHRRK